MTAVTGPAARQEAAEHSSGYRCTYCYRRRIVITVRVQPEHAPWCPRLRWLQRTMTAQAGAAA